MKISSNDLGFPLSFKSQAGQSNAEPRFAGNPQRLPASPVRFGDGDAGGGDYTFSLGSDINLQEQLANSLGLNVDQLQAALAQIHAGETGLSAGAGASPQADNSYFSEDKSNPHVKEKHHNGAPPWFSSLGRAVQSFFAPKSSSNGRVSSPHSAPGVTHLSKVENEHASAPSPSLPLSQDQSKSFFQSPIKMIATGLGGIVIGGLLKLTIIGAGLGLVLSMGGAGLLGYGFYRYFRPANPPESDVIYRPIDG